MLRRVRVIFLFFFLPNFTPHPFLAGPYTLFASHASLYVVGRHWLGVIFPGSKTGTMLFSLTDIKLNNNSSPCPTTRRNLIWCSPTNLKCYGAWPHDAHRHSWSTYRLLGSFIITNPISIDSLPHIYHVTEPSAGLASFLKRPQPTTSWRHQVSFMNPCCALHEGLVPTLQYHGLSIINERTLWGKPNILPWAPLPGGFSPAPTHTC
jgi:hypothetical protein